MLMSPSEVHKQLLSHPCFGDSIVLSDDQLRRLRKDTEQRVMNFRAHLALNEPVSCRPDSLKHFASLQKWRRSGFEFHRFETIAVLPTDSAISLARDYKLPSEVDIMNDV